MTRSCLQYHPQLSLLHDFDETIGRNKEENFEISSAGSSFVIPHTIFYSLWESATHLWLIRDGDGNSFHALLTRVWLFAGESVRMRHVEHINIV
jgi:hypothetical protein